MSTIQTRLAVAALPVLLFAGAPGAAALPPVEGGSSETIYTVEGDIQPPKKVYAPAPEYPEAAREEKADGTVVVRTVIDKTGEVREAKAVRSDGEDLAEASVEAVRRWRFEPATPDGEPVDVHYNLTIRFRLDHDDEEQRVDDPDDR